MSEAILSYIVVPPTVEALSHGSRITYTSHSYHRPLSTSIDRPRAKDDNHPQPNSYPQAQATTVEVHSLRQEQCPRKDATQHPLERTAYGAVPLS